MGHNNEYKPLGDKIMTKEETLDAVEKAQLRKIINEHDTETAIEIIEQIINGKNVESVDIKTKKEQWVKCIQDANDLTEGKKYLVINEIDRLYAMEDDKETCWRNKILFKPPKTDLQKFKKFFKRMGCEFADIPDYSDDYWLEVTKGTTRVGLFSFTKDGKFIR